jgi:WD40 repeat protein
MWQADEPDRFQHLDLVDLIASKSFRMPPSWSSIAISPTGDRLYLLGVSGMIYAWSLEGSRVIRQEWSAGTGLSAGSLGRRNVPMALSSDGSTLGIINASRGVTLIDTDKGTVRAHVRVPEGESDNQASAIAFSPADHEFVVGTSQGFLYLYSLDHPSVAQIRLPGQRGFVFQTTYDPTGRYLAALGRNAKAVEVWDVDRIRSELDRLDLGW